MQEISKNSQFHRCLPGLPDVPLTHILIDYLNLHFPPFFIKGPFFQPVSHQKILAGWAWDLNKRCTWLNDCTWMATWHIRVLRPTPIPRTLTCRLDGFFLVGERTYQEVWSGWVAVWVVKCWVPIIRTDVLVREENPDFDEILLSSPNSWKWQAVRPFSQHSNVTRVLWELKLDIQLGALIPMICFHGDLLDPEKAAWRSCSWSFLWPVIQVCTWCQKRLLIEMWYPRITSKSNPLTCNFNIKIQIYKDPVKLKLRNRAQAVISYLYRISSVRSFSWTRCRYGRPPTNHTRSGSDRRAAWWCLQAIRYLAFGLTWEYFSTHASFTVRVRGFLLHDRFCVGIGRLFIDAYPFLGLFLLTMTHPIWAPFAVRTWSLGIF